jgi:type I restriction enzyme S subunit
MCCTSGKLTNSDLLISRRSLTYDGAAKPSMIPISSEPLIFESSMIRVCPMQNKIRTQYLFQYLSDSSVKNHFIRKYVTGATIKGINQKNLENIRVIVPPLNLQDAFIEKVTSIHKLAKTMDLQFSEMDAFFNALSQKAFSGSL